MLILYTNLLLSDAYLLATVTQYLPFPHTISLSHPIDSHFPAYLSYTPKWQQKKIIKFHVFAVGWSLPKFYTFPNLS
jgi:hypothetical protein